MTATGHITKENGKKQRSSNFELLRIIAMLMIIIYHIICHCVNYQLTDTGSMALMNNGYFNQPYVYKKLFLIYLCMPFGIIANALFILISGYFMVPKKENINIVKSTKKLLSQQFFAAVVLMIASLVLYRISGEGKSFYVMFQSITDFNYMSWFVGYYFAVLLTAYLFLNRYLGKWNQKQYLTFLVITFAFVQLSFTGGTIENLAGNLRTYLTGIFLYAMGGYARTYMPLKKVKTWVLFLVIILAYLCVGISSYNWAAQNVENYIRTKSTDPYIQVVNGYENYSIVIMIISISMFEIFRRIHIRTSKVINFFGSATFMIYLLHDDNLFYSIWRNYDWIRLLYFHPWRFIPEVLEWALGTFGVCTIIYLLYLATGKVWNKTKHLFID